MKTKSTKKSAPIKVAPTIKGNKRMKEKKIKKAKIDVPLTITRKMNGEDVAERVYTNMPHGFSVTKNTTTQPLGTVWANNGKSFFAKKPNGKPARKSILVIKDMDLFKDNPKRNKSSAKKQTSTATKQNKPKKSASKKATKPSAKKTAQKVTKKTPAKKTVAKKPATKTAAKAKAKPSAAKKKTTTDKKPATKATQASKKPANTKQSATKQSKLVTVEIKIHGDDNGGHPHVMIGQVQDKNVSVGLTSKSKKGKNHPNIKLEHNPLKNKKTSHMRRQGTVDKKSNYRSTSQTGKLTQADNEKAQKIGNKAKQKYLDNQKDKK